MLLDGEVPPCDGPGRATSDPMYGRDHLVGGDGWRHASDAGAQARDGHRPDRFGMVIDREAASYTHLTLPTIYSV